MRGRFIWLLGAGLLATSVQAQVDEVARRFGTLDGITQVSLSPDGRKIAFLAPNKGEANDLFVVDVDGDASPRRILRASGDPEILQWCRWATDARLICQIGGREKLGDFIYGFSSLLGVDAAGGNVKTLSTRRGDNAVGIDFRGGSVIDWQPGTPNNVLVMRSHVPEATLIAKEDAGMGVDLMDVSQGTVKVIEKPRRDAREYITDGKGRVRIMGTQPMEGRTGNLSGTLRYFFKPAAGGDWQPLSSYDVVSREGFDPWAVDAATNRAIGFGRIDGRQAVMAVNLDGTGKGETLYRHPEVDVNELVQVGRDRRVVGATYATERRQMVTTDPNVAAMAKSLSRALGGREVYFIDASADEAHWLLWSGSDVDPGRYYRYTPAAKQLRRLLENRPLLAEQPLSAVRPIKYPAADGTMVPGYLTLPPGRADAKGLPAIVMPHGGPSARDEWGFDWMAQYFAQRGFAVVQPNFRGSSGYGDSWYQNNGFQSWKTAVGDVADAGRWVVAEGADPAKLSIVGWSYGGYAALQSGVLAPDLFKSIVAIAPVTDLGKMKDQSMRVTNGAITRDFIGSGPHVREGSPAQNAGAIKAQVLMFHGTLDQHVDIDQARIMRSALTSAGKKVELIEYSGLAHNLWDSETRIAMLGRISAFLPH
ncbi:dipeptidyl aminopeptidase/acylaminoacyl peptidase [Sphingopyxis sp. OAS728]|uniref:S9 family peptidase n=1 Tax=Sphingopyxis sp. OAS728 TaxID=2663823 RepID=UPI0019E38014|nr:alpha/beta fold hydrolase [Sphingopyxis sp. OAS728]MBE1525603.1 dipeptidyl aminopeptidase/acylaminoacyl peptidase [Sphingopyxis sp. OAS728]